MTCLNKTSGFPVLTCCLHQPESDTAMEPAPKKKILVVSRCAWTLYNFRRGLILALMANGYDVVCGGAGGDGFEKKLADLGIVFEPLPVDKRGINPLADIRLTLAMYLWYRRHRPDVVHHFTIKPVIYGSVAARLARVPRIVNTITGLGYVFTGEKTTWLRRMVQNMYRVSNHLAHFTFFQNAEDRDFFVNQKLVSCSRTDILPGSGVDCGFFSPRSCVEGPPLVLMVARMLKDKGVYEFVQAARLARAQFPGARFMLLGGRDERNPSVVPEADLLRWQEEQIVAWPGEVQDVRPYLAQAQMVVLPSFYREGVPRSLLEAAAMGKPVITTDSVGCREVVEPGVNGMLVPVKDPQALADAMLALLQDPGLCQSMGQAGRSKMEREFDEAGVIRRVMESYKQSS